MPEPRICASIASPTLGEVLRSLAQLELHRPDLVEVRLDYMGRVEGLDEIRDATKYPLVATCRRLDQGGLFRASERERIGILREACGEGFEYIDIEISTPKAGEIIQELRRGGADPILSYHDLEGTPPRKTITRILKRGLSLRPEIMKIVGLANRYEDNYVYLSTVSESRELGLVSFGMGRLGIPSRVLSPLMGGAFTYASAEESSGCAPGQIPIATLKEIYRLMGVPVG